MESWGTNGRVSSQLGIGVESVRTWVKQRQVDLGEKPGVTTAETERIKALEQENRELCRANEMAESAPSFRDRWSHHRFKINAAVYNLIRITALDAATT